jgi:hypothetical protein
LLHSAWATTASRMAAVSAFNMMFPIHHYLFRIWYLGNFYFMRLAANAHDWIPYQLMFWLANAFSFGLCIWLLYNRSHPTTWCSSNLFSLIVIATRMTSILVMRIDITTTTRSNSTLINELSWSRRMPKLFLVLLLLSFSMVTLLVIMTIHYFYIFVQFSNKSKRLN